jgi:hypothetical protein
VIFALLGDFWFVKFLIFNNEVPKIFGYFPYLSFIFETMRWATF